jgi:bacillithiol synthase
MAYLALAHGLLSDPGELARRYLEEFHRVESFYASDYRRPEDLAAAAQRLLNRTWRARFQRGATADLLQAYVQRHPAPRPVHDNIAKLRGREAVCVVTGQQAGLGGGPLLALYKAVTALRLAREVELALGRPCVPVFWNASDDSDLEEVNRLRGQSETGALRRFRFNLPAGKRPVRDVALPGPDDPQWAQAEAALGDGPHRERAALLLRDGAGRDFGEAFTRLLLELLGSRGLVVVEPRALAAHPAWKRLCAREIELHEEHRRALQRTAERLEAQGLSAGVAVTSHLNLFHIERGERRRVTAEGRRLVVEGREGGLSRTGLLKELRRDPAAFTPNVVLRPLVQNAIFPVLAYVGGPAEVAYHALLKGLHRAAGVFMPALFPRLSMTLVRPGDASRLQEALQFRQRLRWRQGGAGVLSETARGQIETAMEELARELGNLGKGLDPEVRRLEQRSAKAVADVMTRITHEPLKLVEGGERFEGVLSQYLPEDKPQERVITVLSAYARYGPRLLELAEGAPGPFEYPHWLADDAPVS